MDSKTPVELEAAIRQYRHNNVPDFVFGYDMEIVNALVAKLNARIAELDEDNCYMRGYCAGWRDAIQEIREKLDVLGGV